jgi:hypothetical protein
MNLSSLISIDVHCRKTLCRRRKGKDVPHRMCGENDKEKTMQGISVRMTKNTGRITVGILLVVVEGRVSPRRGFRQYSEVDEPLSAAIWRIPSDWRKRIVKPTPGRGLRKTSPMLMRNNQIMLLNDAKYT